MNERNLGEQQKQNRVNNKLLDELDVKMYNTLIKILRIYEPSKNDLESLLLLYNMTINIYNKPSMLKLNPLKYTDLNEVKSVLVNYGYLKEEVEHESDNKEIVPNVDIEQQKKDNSNPVVDIMYDSNEQRENKDLFVEQKDPFNANGPVYAFSNEALNQYMKNYDFKGKSILASLGSGDFALNAYLLGAKEVETFDINQYTYYFYQLKKALIMKYSYEDFCTLIKNPQDIFKKFYEYKKFLNPESISFFEHLLKLYNGDIFGLLKKVYIDKIGEEKNQWNESNTFDTSLEFFLIAQYKNYYLQSSENYNRLKEELLTHKDDKFYFEDLYKFTPSKKYDIVYLSNIGDYNESEEVFKEFVSQLRESLLNENGVIRVVSITNYIMMTTDSCIRTKMDWDDMEKFNEIHKGVARLPISNLGIQNVYTTHPYKTKKHIL